MYVPVFSSPNEEFIAMKIFMLACCVWAVPTFALADNPWRLDSALTLQRFEQQVKTEVGGVRGERLVEQTHLGLMVMGSYTVWGPLSFGAYLQYDVGFRGAARFSTFAADGTAMVVDETGGAYQELWAGPFMRVHWQTLFAELGYGAVGIRDDEARDDLVDTEGNADDALRTLPSVAWFLGLGGGIPVSSNLEVVLRLEYRVRYYNRRGSLNLRDETVHGTQEFTPFAGVAWRL